MAAREREIEVTAEWVSPPSQAALHDVYRMMYERKQAEKRREATATLSNAEFEVEKDK